MNNIIKPDPADFADIEDYFVALDAYYEVTVYGSLLVTAA